MCVPDLVLLEGNYVIAESNFRVFFLPRRVSWMGKNDIDVCWGGDGLAQCLELWTVDPKVEGSNPVRSTRKTLSFFRV